MRGSHMKIFSSEGKKKWKKNNTNLRGLIFFFDFFSLFFISLERFKWAFNIKIKPERYKG